MNHEFASEARAAPTRGRSVGSWLLWWPAGRSSLFSWLIRSSLRWRAEKQASDDLDRGARHSLMCQIVEPHFKHASRKSWRCRARSPLGTRPRSTAQVAGYVRSWKQGHRRPVVKKGDVLAEVDTPELDERIAQASEELGRAASGAVDGQGDGGSLGRAAQFLRRIQAVEPTKKRAINRSSRPMSGRPAPISTGSRRRKPSPGSSRPSMAWSPPAILTSAPMSRRIAQRRALFKVADIHAVRLYVDVPQIYSARLTSGMKAIFTTPQWPDREFLGDNRHDFQRHWRETGSLLVELDTPNPDGALVLRLLCRRAFRIAGRSPPVAHAIRARFRSASTARAWPRSTAIAESRFKMWSSPRILARKS